MKFPADTLSDLDLVIITTNPSRYLNETAWFEALGEVLLSFIEETGVGQQFERRVLYRVVSTSTSQSFPTVLHAC